MSDPRRVFSIFSEFPNGGSRSGSIHHHHRHHHDRRRRLVSDRLNTLWRCTAKSTCFIRTKRSERGERVAVRRAVRSKTIFLSAIRRPIAVEFCGFRISKVLCFRWIFFSGIFRGGRCENRRWSSVVGVVILSRLCCFGFFFKCYLWIFFEEIDWYFWKWVKGSIWFVLGFFFKYIIIFRVDIHLIDDTYLQMINIIK